jgi:hypothetical protein
LDPAVFAQRAAVNRSGPFVTLRCDPGAH